MHCTLTPLHQARAVRPTPPQASCHRRPARRPLRYKSDGATEATTEVPRQQQQVQLSADDVMADMCTMLGGINTDCFTGYAGQWRTWEVLPTQQLQQQQQPPAHDDSPNPTTTGPSSSSPDSQHTHASPPPAATVQCTTSTGQHSIRLIDNSINVRLWRLQEGGSIGLQKAEAAAAASPDTIQQANFYHHPVKMAGPSTRFAPCGFVSDKLTAGMWCCVTDSWQLGLDEMLLLEGRGKETPTTRRPLEDLTGNTMAGRPDGYGLRVWSFTRGSGMLQPDASSWLDGSGTPAECSMRVLTVPGRGTTIVNGALPSGFGEGHSPRFWVLEFIAKDPGSADRRWASMNWYDLGQLVVNRSINEDRLQLAGEPEEICIDPSDIHFSDRRDGLLPLDIDAWACQHNSTQRGTATVFSWASVPGDKGAQELHLVRSPDCPCAWTNPFETTGTSQPSDAAAATSTTSSSSGGGSTSKQQQQQQQQQQRGKDQEEGGAGTQGVVDVVVQVYPDWSYCRVPRSIEEVVGSGLDSAVFEAGTVLRDGSLVRWLLEYETTGRRLIKAVRFETYPLAAAAVE